MGRIAGQIRKKLARMRHQDVFQNEELQALKKDFEYNWKKALIVPESWVGKRHPVFALCVTTQNMLSVIAELLTDFQPMEKWVSILTEAEDEYYPQGPPISPVTASFFSYWSIFDLPVAKEGETLGTISSELSDLIGLSENAANMIMEMQNTRMGVYEFLGSKDGYVHLKEVITGKHLKCWVASGYSPSIASTALRKKVGYPDHWKELWFVRTFLGSFVNGDISIVLNTPYILMLPEVQDWTAFVQRTLQSNSTKQVLPYELFMKFGLSPYYWLEYVFQAYSNHLHDAVFITGIPDIPHSLPHSTSKTGDRQ